MTAHELARQLLEGPDVPILVATGNGRDIYSSQPQPVSWSAWRAGDERWRVTGHGPPSGVDGGSIEVVCLVPR